MGYVEGSDRDQQVLFPEVLDEYVGDENPVRFLDAFVASLDLAALGFQRATPSEIGRPDYDRAISFVCISTAISIASGRVASLNRRRTGTWS